MSNDDTIPGAAPMPPRIQIIAPDGSVFGARFLGYTKEPDVRIRVGVPIAESLFSAKGAGQGKAKGWKIHDASMPTILAASPVPVAPSIAAPKVETSAVVSDDKLYRYELARWWKPGPRMLYVMLNPSTADHRRDDPTIRRCVSFAQREGFSGIEVVNLFSYRTAYPKVLRQAVADGIDVVGKLNDIAIERAARRVTRVVVAWGGGVKFGHKSRLTAFRGRDKTVLGILRSCGPVYRFARPTQASPVPHPLMLPADTPIERWDGESR